jgi:hypothetical protein
MSKDTSQHRANAWRGVAWRSIRIRRRRISSWRWRWDERPTWRAGSGASRWSAGRALVAGQVALSVVVLFSAGVLVRSLRKLTQVDTGYERAHLLLLRVDPRSVGYSGDAYVNFCNQLLGGCVSFRA